MPGLPATSIRVEFIDEQVSTVRCKGCDRAYTLLKPTIGDEILLDWEQEALYHKLRAIAVRTG